MSDEDRIKWNERYSQPADAPRFPSQHLLDLDALLPRSGKALDIAGGAGRNSLWLAQRGLEVTLVDISAKGLALASERAETAGATLTTICRDLEQESLPVGPWDVMLSFHYLQRSLWPAMRAALAPGGWLVFVQPTVKNLQRHARPPRGFLLDEGEGRDVADGLEIVRYDEGWLVEGRHEVLVVARRTPTRAL